LQIEKLFQINFRGKEYYYYWYNNILNTDEVAGYTRGTIAENLGKSPYQANIIVAFYDIDVPKLHCMDYLGSSCKVTKDVHGYEYISITEYAQFL
jgi:20S proteasome alpha/beta subunit